MECPYCHHPAKLVTGTALYPHRPDLFEKWFYLCFPCDAHVGCHPGTTNPLGRLANPELRTAKIEAHAAFDPIWRNAGKKRGEAYAWLARKLGIPKPQCHIGMFDVATCHRVIEICQGRR